jgi:E3 ubiquitin-protein ligase NEDD4
MSDTGRAYTVDHKTKTTAWADPIHNKTMSVSTIEPVSYEYNKEIDPKITPGIEIRYTSYGRAYYADHKTRTTSWADPKYNKTTVNDNTNSVTVDHK